jgi:hypothetical protein
MRGSIIDILFTQAQASILEAAQTQLEAHLTSRGFDASHGIEHACIVRHNVCSAMWHDLPQNGGHGEVPQDKRLAIALAAALHDADDYKVIGKAEAARYEYAHAQRILREALSDEETIELVVRMIDLVSASKNKDNKPDGLPEWMFYPRYADRIEAQR